MDNPLLIPSRAAWRSSCCWLLLLRLRGKARRRRPPRTRTRPGRRLEDGELDAAADGDAGSTTTPTWCRCSPTMTTPPTTRPDEHGDARRRRASRRDGREPGALHAWIRRRSHCRSASPSTCATCGRRSAPCRRRWSARTPPDPDAARAGRAAFRRQVTAALRGPRRAHPRGREPGAHPGPGGRRHRAPRRPRRGGPPGAAHGQVRPQRRADVARRPAVRRRAGRARPRPRRHRARPGPAAAAQSRPRRSPQPQAQRRSPQPAVEPEPAAARPVTTPLASALAAGAATDAPVRPRPRPRPVRRGRGSSCRRPADPDLVLPVPHPPCAGSQRSAPVAAAGTAPETEDLTMTTPAPGIDEPAPVRERLADLSRAKLRRRRRPRGPAGRLGRRPRRPRAAALGQRPRRGPRPRRPARRHRRPPWPRRSTPWRPPATSPAGRPPRWSSSPAQALRDDVRRLRPRRPRRGLRRPRAPGRPGPGGPGRPGPSTAGAGWAPPPPRSSSSSCSPRPATAWRWRPSWPPSASTRRRTGCPGRPTRPRSRPTSSPRPRWPATTSWRRSDLRWALAEELTRAAYRPGTTLADSVAARRTQLLALLGSAEQGVLEQTFEPVPAPPGGRR